MVRPEPTPVRFPVVCLLGLVTSLTGCGGGGGDAGPPPTPAAIAVTSGSGQSGEAGSALAQPIVVQVTSSSGAPVEGAAVTFATGSTSGSVAAAQATTDGDGRASTAWTVGTEAGANSDTVLASVTGVTTPAVFTATITAAAAASLASVSGDAQGGAPGQPLGQPLVVEVRDRFGNPRSNVTVGWTVTSGGGTVSPGTGTTGADGRTSTIWTLGSSGVNTVEAAAPGLTGSPVTFTATGAAPGDILLTSINPSTMVEGQPATLIGSGFSTTPGENGVRIDGVEAAVTGATPTSLIIQIPAFNCQPARRVEVQVRVGSKASNALNPELHPAGFTSVASGQQLVLTNPQEFCLQFAPATAEEHYLIGVQSTSEVVTSLTPARLTAVAAGQATAARLPEMARRTVAKSRFDLLKNPGLRLLAGHRAAEAKLRAAERQQVYPLLPRVSQTAVQRSRTIPPVVQPGDIIPIRYPGEGNICTSYIETPMVVRVIGQRGIWLEDPENPAGGLTGEDIQRLSDEFDSRIYTTITNYFGAPTDLDGNERIAIALTKLVNEIHPGIAGHVGLPDLVPRTVCPSSDEGEIYYGVVPDPGGEFGDPVSREAVVSIAVQTIAHEFTHIVQAGQRFILHDLPPQSGWVMEGQAMVGEEITGHAYEGRTTGQNYGAEIAFNLDDEASIDWYSQAFFGLLLYYGFEDPISRVPGAPEECSWLAAKPENPGPCVGGLDVYGAPWSLLRWMSDQFGPTHPNGEGGLHRALILSPTTGYASLAAVTGVPANTLLAQWAAMLYVDDRVPGAAPPLRLTSWNLLDIENNVVETAHLIPRPRGFASFNDSFRVRGGSSAYFRVSGVGRRGTAIRIRTPSDQVLPNTMQVFVVRLQ